MLYLVNPEINCTGKFVKRAQQISHISLIILMHCFIIPNYLTLKCHPSSANVVHSHSMYYMTLDGIKVRFQKNKPVWIEMNSTIANILICEGVIGLGILISNILFSDLILNLMFSLTSPILTGLFRNITNAKVKTFATRVFSEKNSSLISFCKGCTAGHLNCIQPCQLMN